MELGIPIDSGSDSEYQVCSYTPLLHCQDEEESSEIYVQPPPKRRRNEDDKDLLSIIR